MGLFRKSGPPAGTILLVDPFPDERDMYAEFLRFDGFEVSLCATPSAALARARSSNVVAVITRVRQSGDLDGIALTRLLKGDSATRSIPVVVITSHMEAHVCTAAHEAGCDAFLMIPCAPDLLAGEVRRVAKSPRRAPTRLVAGADGGSGRGAS
jgi:CheY-like chemotaxis protein